MLFNKNFPENIAEIITEVPGQIVVVRNGSKYWLLPTATSQLKKRWTKLLIDNEVDIDDKIIFYRSFINVFELAVFTTHGLKKTQWFNEYEFPKSITTAYKSQLEVPNFATSWLPTSKDEFSQTGAFYIHVLVKSDHLMIPTQFIYAARLHKKSRIELKTGKRSWEVTLDNTGFGSGWTEFYEDHNLTQKTIFFFLRRNYSFRAVIFDDEQNEVFYPWYNSVSITCA